MKKHGLINDLKKLDSFNQFIEQHSPRNEYNIAQSFSGEINMMDNSVLAELKVKRNSSGNSIGLKESSSDYQFPFQRRARSISPPKIQQKNEAIGKAMSPKHSN